MGAPTFTETPWTVLILNVGIAVKWLQWNPEGFQSKQKRYILLSAFVLWPKSLKSLKFIKTCQKVFGWYLGALWDSFGSSGELRGGPWALLEITLKVFAFFWELCWRSWGFLAVHFEAIWDTLVCPSDTFQRNVFWRFLLILLALHALSTRTLNYTGDPSWAFRSLLIQVYIVYINI